MFDEVPRAAGIYAIVNIANGHRYVGQAKNMNSRVRTHFQKLDKGTHSEGHLQEAWRRYGRDAFKIVVLEVVHSNKATEEYPDNLSLAEHHYINERGEYNKDKAIVSSQFRSLIEAKAWRNSTRSAHALDGSPDPNEGEHGA